MHPYPDQILPPPNGGIDGGSGDAPPALVRIVRDGLTARASCPHCGGGLELSTVGTRWHVRHPADVADRLLLQLGPLEHPSGDATPSPDDLHLTAEAVAAGLLLDIPVLDHLVIAGSTYISLRERGVAFDSPGDHERLRRSVTSEDPASRRGGSPSLGIGGAQ